MNWSTLNRLALLFSAIVLMAGCATTGHPCFSDRVMYPDKTASCQYGRSYRCDNGDWIAYRQSCAETAPALAANGSCDFGEISYATGSSSCQAGRQYVCENGSWRSLDRLCTMGDAPLPVRRYGASCAYGEATVASSWTLCQGGTTFLCSDGAWINLGTDCR